MTDVLTLHHNGNTTLKQTGALKRSEKDVGKKLGDAEKTQEFDRNVQLVQKKGDIDDNSAGRERAIDAGDREVLFSRQFEFGLRSKLEQVLDEVLPSQIDVNALSGDEVSQRGSDTDEIDIHRDVEGLYRIFSISGQKGDFSDFSEFSITAINQILAPINVPLVRDEYMPKSESLDGVAKPVQTELAAIKDVPQRAAVLFSGYNVQKIEQKEFSEQIEIIEATSASNGTKGGPTLVGLANIDASSHNNIFAKPVFEVTETSGVLNARLAPERVPGISRIIFDVDVGMNRLRLSVSLNGDQVRMGVSGTENSRIAGVAVDTARIQEAFEKQGLSLASLRVGSMVQITNAIGSSPNSDNGLLGSSSGNSSFHADDNDRENRNDSTSTRYQKASPAEREDSESTGSPDNYTSNYL